MERLIGIFVSCCIVLKCQTDHPPTKTLISTVGGNVTLPEQIEERGAVIYGGKTIAMVTRKSLEIWEDKYLHRLLWNQSGYFTLTELQKNDSGSYVIDSKTKGNIVIFELKVYASVAPPVVEVWNQSSDCCTLTCTVYSADEDTEIRWYQDQQLLTSRTSAGSLSLTLSSWHRINSSFRCVSRNPAGNRSDTVDVWTLCDGSPAHSASTDLPLYWLALPVCVVFIVCISIMTSRRRCTTKKSVNTEDVQYADINICDGQRSKRGSAAVLPGSVDRSNLTTVYDQLEVHRMTP